MQVKDVMTRNVDTVNPNDTLEETAERMKNLNVGSMPVTEDGRVIGIVTDRDITVRATAEGYDASRTRVRDVMSHNVTSVHTDDDVQQAATMMRDQQVRRLPVLDQNQRLVGIVSLGDLATDMPSEQKSGETLKGVSKPSQPRH